MEPKLLVLKRYLQALGVPVSIADLKDRKRVQKAVYLGQQVAQVDLGYRFNWYVMGPYSPDLTKDYYEMATSADAASTEQDLRDDVKERLVHLQQLFASPAGVASEDWLEAIASWHYLTKLAGQTTAEARATISSKKPHVLPFLQAAIDRLTAAA